MTLEEALKKYPGAATFRFGDSAAMDDALIALVVAGKKRATCGALRDFGEGGEETPVVGRRDIVTRWDGTPAVVIETVDVSYATFQEISEDFALAEGENDDLEGWRRDHRAYFERNGGWSADMALICERFEVVEVF